MTTTALVSVISEKSQNWPSRLRQLACDRDAVERCMRSVLAVKLDSAELVSFDLMAGLIRVVEVPQQMRRYANGSVVELDGTAKELYPCAFEALVDDIYALVRILQADMEAKHHDRLPHTVDEHIEYHDRLDKKRSGSWKEGLTRNRRLQIHVRQQIALNTFGVRY